MRRRPSATTTPSTACPSSTAARGAAAQGRARHRQRHGRDRGRRDLPAPAPRARQDVLRARRHLPQPPARSARGGEPPRDHGARGRGEGATSASPGTATPTAASSSTTPAPFVPGDFVTALLGEAFVRQGAGGQDRLRRARLPRGARPRGGRGRHGAHEPRRATPSSRSACATRTPSSAARSPGHFYFRDNWYADNGMIPALLVLEMLGARAARSFSELLAPLRARYHISGEINSKVADVPRRCAPHRGALPGRPHPQAWTASPWTTTTGTSTCGPRTRSRCSA